MCTTVYCEYIHTSSRLINLLINKWSWLAFDHFCALDCACVGSKSGKETSQYKLCKHAGV